MARNLYGCTSADFTLTESGRVVAGATATVWTARTGGTQITDLTDVDGGAITSVTSDADGGIRFYGVDGDKDAYWLDTGTGARIAVRPVDLTGETGPTPVLSIGTVGTGAAAANLTGTSEAPVLNLTLPAAGTNSITTAMLQDAAVTYAKLGADVRIGNLLTANQASIEYGTTGLEAWDSCTISRSADVPLHGSYGLKVTPTGASPIAGIAAPGVPVTPGRAYTFVTDLYATAAATMNGVIHWRKSDNTLISVSVSPNIVFTGEDREWAVVNATAPALAAYAMVGAQSTDAVHAFYMDCLGFWEGTSTAKSWAMPGTPIVGLSHIATNGAVHLSGTGSPEGVVTAAPGSTWLQTDATTDVKGWIRWVKATGTGTTGWVAGPEYDSGTRNVGALLESAWDLSLAAPYVYLRRRGNLVSLTGRINRASAGGSRSDMSAVLTLPAGFTPGTALYVPLGVALGPNYIQGQVMNVASASLVDVQFQAGSGTYATGDDVLLSASFLTNDAAPPTLPGDAA